MPSPAMTNERRLRNEPNKARCFQSEGTQIGSGKGGRGLARVCGTASQGGIHGYEREGSRAMRRLPATLAIRSRTVPACKPTVHVDDPGSHYDDAGGRKSAANKLHRATHHKKLHPFFGYLWGHGHYPTRNFQPGNRGPRSQENVAPMRHSSRTTTLWPRF